MVNSNESCINHCQIYREGELVKVVLVVIKCPFGLLPCLLYWWSNQHIKEIYGVAALISPSQRIRREWGGEIRDGGGYQGCARQSSSPFKCSLQAWQVYQLYKEGKWGSARLPNTRQSFVMGECWPLPLCLPEWWWFRKQILTPFKKQFLWNNQSFHPLSHIPEVARGEQE